jgi:uncharacterized protein (DUF1697 family)
VARYVAFLRAINVGGHTVTKERLIAEFEALGLEDVGTFIASGNVLFRKTGADTAALERRIEAQLRTALGYDVATFVRSATEVKRIADHDAFPSEPAGADDHLYVTLLHRPPAAAVRRQVLALATDHDRLHIRSREIYWLAHGKMLDSTIDWKVVGKLLAAETTNRNMNTIRRLAEQL